MTLLMATVSHDKVPAFRGTFTFDGHAYEAFGFAEVHSTRVPVELIENIELSLDKGVIKTPSLKVEASGGSLGLEQPLEPSESDLPALRALVEAVQQAIDGRSGS